MLNRWELVHEFAQLVISRQSSPRANCWKHSHRLSVIAPSSKTVLNAKKALPKSLTVNVIAMKHKTTFVTYKILHVLCPDNLRHRLLKDP